MARMTKRHVWVSRFGLLLLGLCLGGPVAWSADPTGDVPWETVYQQTARSFVVVQYHLKKSDRPPIDGRRGYGSEQRTVLERVLDKNTHEVLGVLLSDSGEVLTSESQPQLAEVVTRITVKGWDGVVVPAQADRILRKAPGRVVRITGPMPESWRALAFTELDVVTPETKLYAATMKVDEQHYIQVAPCAHGRAWNREAIDNQSLQVPGLFHVAVICNAQGRPAGVTVQREIDLGPAGPVWRGTDVLADAGITVDQQKRLEDELEKEFARNIYEITVTFRPEPQEEEAYGYRGRYFSGVGPSGRGGQERLLYGLGFAGSKLLVPQILPRDQIAGIDTISVKADDRDIPARFGGVLEQCSAMVIDLEEGELPRTAGFSVESPLARIEPFWGVFVHELAGKDVRVQYTRWLVKRQGYADEWYPVVARSIRLGSWLLDRQGELVGLYGAARHEHDRLRPHLLGERRGSYRDFSYYASEFMGPSMSYGPYRRASNNRLFQAAELVSMLGDLPAGYDKHLRHLTKEQQKRRVWLGVEYTVPGKEMVKQMDLRDPTQDGRIGLMISRVYVGSPAALLGLTEGDILLTLAVPETPWPIELTSAERERFGMPDYDEADIPAEFEALGMRMPRRRPWPSRDNGLTRMLDDIGAGTTVTLKYIHGRETLEKPFTIEQSPPDMLSAAKYKNEKLGLTVKDLTYEIRAALRLDESQTAVVVTQVEQGTPAALARINRYELIRAVDGQQVENVETFEKLIAEAQEAQKESVRLTVESMGKTRLADLKFEAKGAPGLLKSLIPGLQ